MEDDFLSRIKHIFDTMERSYDEIASHYGFSCKGCTENCCTQRFHHHTLAEYLYLLEGMKKADPELVQTILMRAKVVTDTYWRELEAGEILPLMCPVNTEGRCTLYEYRPMICRMHGLPHRFTKPDATEVRGGGCGRFEEQFTADKTVDRTWAYTELAHLERELRMKLNYRTRIKKTTAEMLMDMLEREPRLQDILEG